MTRQAPIVHAVGSKHLGGAERFFARLIEGQHLAGARVAALVRQGSDVEAVVPAGVAVHTSPMRTVWDPWSRRAMGRAIKRLAPALVQTYMGRATRLLRLPSKAGVVHVARLGGYYALHPYRHAHAWIGNTRGICDYLIANGFPAARVFHIANFVEPPPSVSAAPEVRAELGLAADDFVWVSAGRMIAVKGHAELLQAFARLRGQAGFSHHRLVMVGDGPLRGELQRTCHALGTDHAVRWTGWRRDPAPFYAAADAVVFPSREMETFGNVILEAWAHAKPLVCTRFRGARELVRHAEDALTAPCEDADALALAMQDLAREPRLAHALAEAGHERVAREFNRDTIVGQYLDLYERLIAAP